MKTGVEGCCDSQVMGSGACGCCEGVEVMTPLSTYNRPGLSEIHYRMGTHGSFLESMTARLTGYYLEKQDEAGGSDKVYPLQGLTTRDSEDPALALLDAWSTVADVLTFYQERIANEGYLRTATERRSVVELGRLVGYKPRPGVASSVFLAYTVEETFKEEAIIPAGTGSQSIPGPGELPQSFETREDLKARTQWNNLKPRTSRPQSFDSIKSSNQIYLKGLNTNLKQNDPLLIGVGDKEPELFWIKDIQPDADNDRTQIIIESISLSLAPAPAPVAVAEATEPTISYPIKLIRELTLHPSIPPKNSTKLIRTLNETFELNNFDDDDSINSSTEASHSVLKALAPQLWNTLATSLANVNINSDDQKIRVYALRVKASPFGHNAPLQPIGMNIHKVMTYSEWEIKLPLGSVAKPKAKFKMTITNANGSNITVHFQNLSTGLINSVQWYLDSPLIPSVITSPTHTYTERKEVTISLIVKGPGGEDAIERKINLNIKAGGS